jgi:ppGpp synthetase/RelA/SpoT-type nucleotidyltranferase
MKKQKSPDQMSIDEAIKEYEKKRPLYEEFTKKIESLIEEILRKAGIHFDLIEGRTKSISSFKEKITRSGKQYADPVSELSDLTGIRIVLYYLEDVDAVNKIVEREFRIDKSTSIDKGELLKPHEFGYRSVHYGVILSDDRKKLTEWKTFADLKAEIQIRTILQHAWASISHALQYKREQDVPSEFRRRLFRLSGLLELADEQFSLIRTEETILSQKTIKKIEKGEKNLELNLITLNEYLKKSMLIEGIEASATKIGFEVNERDKKSVSDLISVCNDFHIMNILKLDSILSEVRPWYKEYLQKQYSYMRTEWTVTPAFLVILILFQVFKENVNYDYLVIKGGWDVSVANRVLDVIHIKNVSR